MGVLLSFGPFLLVLASLMLGVFALLLLFYATPHIAFKRHVEWTIAEEVFERLRVSPLTNILLLLIGVAPLLVSVGLLTLSAVLTGMHYISAEAVMGVSLQWFFIMIPFSMLLTPFVVFFFNFAMEGYGFIQKKRDKCASEL
jgi:ABC-type multidrug transport system permease subunit